jgi:hypothetical protein
VRILTRQEWDHLYRTVWRPPLAHLTKTQRAWYVRQCAGKTAYESRAEAWPQMEGLPPIEGKKIGCYRCRLCQWFHIGNSARRFEMAKEKASAGADASPCDDGI